MAEMVLRGQPRAIQIGHHNMGTINKNSVTIGTDKGAVKLYFSYDTLVGVDGVTSENDWSVTTGKFLNELESDKKRRVPHAEVLRQAQERLRQVLY